MPRLLTARPVPPRPGRRVPAPAMTDPGFARPTGTVGDPPRLARRRAVPARVDAREGSAVKIEGGTAYGLNRILTGEAPP